MVELVLDDHGLALDRPSDERTLYIHFRRSDAERTEWPARRVGPAVIGPWEQW
ncbi:hypothetical protein ACWD4P_35655 [Kitasatospora sp. NPDC002543]